MKNVKNVIVVEGEMDAMKVQQYGYPAVAILGARVSADQVEKLSKYENVIIALDSDEAGRNGTKGLVRALRGKVNAISVIKVEGVKDPDECSLEQWKNFVSKRIKM